MTLEKKVAVVTGGGQGLGRAITLALVRAGANVVVADMNLETAEAVAAEVVQAGGEALAVQVDVADEASVDALRERALGRWDRVDILIANAGMYPRSLVVEMPEEEWDRVLDVNVGGQFLCARAFVPAMKRQGSGRIICTASAIAYKGQAGHSHYAASKAAVLGFVRGLARELGPYGITVNSIAPGTANTTMPRQHRSEESLLDRGAKVPLGRIAEPEDIANTAVFLAGDGASYVTGQCLLVTGGDLMV
jgi:3-oxoacyl-[acyl-carrier protein] reductase